MAGALTISTLNNDTGPLATQNGMTGICKAWVNFSANTGTVTINGSFNISSVTRNSTGVFTPNFTTAMPNGNYSAIATSSPAASGNDSMTIQMYASGSSTIVAPSTTSFTFGCVQAVTAYRDPFYVTVAVFSS
jgi:phosphoribosylformylglycinamidine (FGAM) synthase-like enzyme